MAIDVKFLTEILNSELMNKIIYHFNQKNKNEFHLKIKIEILQGFSIISGYKNIDISFELFDHELFENIIYFLKETIESNQIKYLGIVLDILKNLFETELNYYEELEKEISLIINFDKKILFIKKFEELNGLEILDKVFNLQTNEDLIKDVYILINLIDNKKITN
jgi:hypothetical protein